MAKILHRDRCSLRILLMLIPFLSMSFLLEGCASYNCPNLGTHCYGTTTLPANLNGTAGFRGFVTTVQAVSLNGGDGEINDEIWVVDSTSAGCGSLNLCWVEVGLSAGADAGGCALPTNETHIFWAENRPNQAFLCHDQGALHAQEFNQPVFLAITVRPFEPNTFDVEALTCTAVGSNGTCPRRVISGTSSNNTMVASVIQMGMELSGTNGASAPSTNFTESVAPNPNVPLVHWSFLNSDGTLRMDAPVKAGWTTRPSTANSSGGNFFTSCCQ